VALNFLGLGFSFGAKDAGLKTKQRQVASGFSDISGEVEKMGRKAEGGTKPLAHMTDQLSGSSMDKLTASIDNLALSLGKDLPKASHKGADSMHRAAENLESDERKVGGGFHFIRDAVDKLNSILRINKLQAFIQAISLAKLSEIGNHVDSIANSGMNLTTSLEATIVAANKTSRSMGANFGYAGKSLGKFTGEATSMGIALNIGTEKAAEAVYAVSQASKELSAVGLKSAADLAKFSEVSGVGAQELTQIFRQAGKQFNLTDDQLRQLAGSALAAGKDIGDVGGQFKQMPHIMELISRRAAVLGRKLNSQQMADFASQTMAVSQAFYHMGVSGDEAREMATSLATQMVESGESFADMFAGTKDDLHDFAMSIGIGTGDINVAFKSMSQGPAEFMSGMAEMVLKAKKSGKFTAESMNLLRGQLSKTFGPKQAATMIQFFDKADEKQLEMMKTTSKAKGDLGKFAKEGFSTGRTLDESFTLMKDTFVMNFRNIGRSASVDFVNQTGKEFNRFNKQLQAVVKKGGPMANLIVKFSEMHQIGALALIPKTLRPMAGLFGTIVKEATPMIGVLGSLGFRLNMLASPMTLIVSAAAVLGMWFADLRMQGKTTGQAIGIMATKIGQGAKKLWVTVKKWVGALFNYLASVDWGAVFTRVFDALVTVMQAAGDLLRQIPWGQIFEGFMKIIGKLFEFVASKKFADALVNIFEFLGTTIVKLQGMLIHAFERAFEALANVDIGKVAKGIIDTLYRIFMVVGRAVGAAFQKILDLFEYTASAGFRDKLMKIAGGIAEGVKHLINKLFDLVEAAIDFLSKIDLGKAVHNILTTAMHIVEAVLLVLVQAVETFFQRLPELAKKVLDLIIKLFKEIPAAVGQFLSEAGDTLKRILPRIVTAILDAVWDILKAIPGLVMKVLRAIPDIIGSVGELIKGAVNLLVKAVLGIFEGIENWLAKKFPAAAGVIHGVFAALKAIIVAIGKVIGFVIDAIVWVFKKLWSVVGTILKFLWDAFDTLVITPLKFIWGLIKKVGEAIAWLVGKLVSVAKKIGGFLSSVGGFFKSVGSKIASFLGGSSMDLKKILEEAQKKAQNATDNMTEAQKKALAELQAQKDKYNAADRAWQEERKKLDAQQQKDLEARRMTVKQVEVTSTNAVQVMQQASDAAAKGIKDNIELVDKQVRLASSLAMPKMDQSYLDAITAYEKAEEEFNAAMKAKDLEAVKKLGDQEVDMLKEQQKQLGISGHALKELRDEQLKDFSMRVDLMDKLSTDEKKAYQASLDQIFDKNLKSQIALQAMTRAINEGYNQQEASLFQHKQEELRGLGQFDTKRIDIEKKYYQLSNDLEKKRAEDQAKNEQKILLAKNKATEQKLILEQFMGVESETIMKRIANSELKTETDKYAAMSALQQRFAAKSAEVLANIPDSMKDAATRAQSQLNAAYFEQLKEITLNEKMSDTERKKALNDLEAWRISKMEDFKKLVDEQTKSMVASNGAASDSMSKTFDTFSEGLQKKAEESALKSNAAIGSVQKELGVTAEDALNNLKDIAAIDPKKFAEGLRKIKEVYIDFAKTAQDSAKSMLTTTNKSFEEFNKSAVDHWMKQKQNISLMEFNDADIKKLTDTVGKTVERAFTSLTDMITKKVQEAVTKAFIDAFAKVIVEAKKFVKDSMSVFRDLTQQMIKQFGDAWQKILGFTTTALQAIEKDTERAVANLKRIELAMRGTLAAKAETAGADVKQDVKMDTTKSDLGNIFQATHHPEWYENDFKYKAMEIIAALNGLAAALSKVPTGGQTAGTASARAQGQIRAGTQAPGIGDSRVKGSLGGGQR